MASDVTPRQSQRGLPPQELASQGPWAQAYQNTKDLKNYIGYLIKKKKATQKVKQPDSPGKMAGPRLE